MKFTHYLLQNIQSATRADAKIEGQKPDLKLIGNRAIIFSLNDKLKSQREPQIHLLYINLLYLASHSMEGFYLGEFSHFISF